MGFGYESCDVVGGVGDGGVPFDSGGVLTWWRFQSVVVLMMGCRVGVVVVVGGEEVA
jgi:hypothetical protein